MQAKRFVEYSLDSLINRDDGVRYLARQVGADHTGLMQPTKDKSMSSCILARMSNGARTPLYYVLTENTKGNKGDKNFGDVGDYWSIMVLEKGEPISEDTEAEIKKALGALAR